MAAPDNSFEQHGFLSWSLGNSPSNVILRWKDISAADKALIDAKAAELGLSVTYVQAPFSRLELKSAQEKLWSSTREFAAMGVNLTGLDLDANGNTVVAYVTFVNPLAGLMVDELSARATQIAGIPVRVSLQAPGIFPVAMGFSNLFDMLWHVMGSGSSSTGPQSISQTLGS